MEKFSQRPADRKIDRDPIRLGKSTAWRLVHLSPGSRGSGRAVCALPDLSNAQGHFEPLFIGQYRRPTGPVDPGNKHHWITDSRGNSNL